MQIGGVNVSAADWAGFNAICEIAMDPEKAKATAADMKKQHEANEETLAALREEREKADKALDAAEVAQKAAQKLRDEVEVMRTTAMAEAAETRANHSQEVALAARGALERKPLRSSGDEGVRREQHVDPHSARLRVKRQAAEAGARGDG